MATARAVIEEQGHGALTMRELAQQLQVAPSALYRHFSNRVDLLLALADETHLELGRDLQRVVATCAEPWAALEAACLAFLAFSQAHPRMFRMMYDAEVLEMPQADARLQALQQNYAVLLDLFRRALPGATQTQLRLRMVAFWSALYGYTATRSNKILRSYMTQDLSEQDMERSMLQAALGRPAAARPLSSRG